MAFALGARRVCERLSERGGREVAGGGHRFLITLAMIKISVPTHFLLHLPPAMSRIICPRLGGMPVATWIVFGLSSALFLGSVVVSVAAEQSSNPQDSSALTAAIDRQLKEQWEANGVTAAPHCSDEEFVRRVYLDLVGRVPTLVERHNFLNDQRDGKRKLLVQLLLTSEDYVQHMADTFDTLLMGRGDAREYRERTQYQWRTWLERVFRENRPWNNVVADVLLARPSSPEEQGAVWYLYERNGNHQAIAEAVAPAFFGIRIDCAQCHDHMVAGEIAQQHYWGLVAFFNRSKNEKTKRGPRLAESAIGGFSEFANLEGASSPNVLTFLDSPIIEEKRPDKDAKQEDSDDLYLASSVEGEPRVPKFSRRERFVKEIVQDHPMIARAFVNRTWAMIMGRGIVHPYDQMDSVHVPSHPELLDELADDFRSSGYDIRRLITAIMNCDAYQRASRRPDGVDDPSLFAQYLPRPLTAEQMSRSIQLGLRGRFENHHPLVAQIREKLPEVMPETVVTPIRESLFLTNNPALNQFIAESHEADHLTVRASKMHSVVDAVNELSLTLLGRLPDVEERERLTDFLGEPVQDGTLSLSRLQHVVWAMITSAEFRFNH